VEVEDAAEEVIHRALESLETEKRWLQESKAAIHKTIERGFGLFERGEVQDVRG
jgi:hypothetical protein